MFSSFLNRRHRSHNIKTNAKSFENVAKFKYLGTTLTNEQCGYVESRAGEFRQRLLPLISKYFAFQFDIPK